MPRRKYALQLALFVAYVAMFSTMFFVTTGRLLTLVVGANIGVGLTGAALAALKLVRPDRYQFVHEA